MGWTYNHREKGMSNETYWRREWPSLMDNVLKIAAPNTSETYMAYQKPGTDEVTAIVVMTQYVRGDYFNFGYKEMDESAGPGIDHCPKSILELLTNPAPNEYARRWRERAWDHIAYGAARLERIRRERARMRQLRAGQAISA